MEPVKQTGLLTKVIETDYLLGSSPLANTPLVPGGSWLLWKPADERQNKPFVFDTKSCTTFSALNVSETMINFFMDRMLLTDIQKEWLKENGFIARDGKINFSDRFTAIMSGTTDAGNYMQAVWDSMRKDGLIAETDLPFKGDTFAEYHNRSDITAAMIAKAKGILEIFKFNYQWPTNANWSDHLTYCPIHAAIQSKSHAVELIAPEIRFDTYDPYLFPQPDPIDYGLMGMVSVRDPIERTLSYGMKGLDVKHLQAWLRDLGFFSYPTNTGSFGQVTKNAVIAFQKAHKISPIGIVGPITLAKLLALKKKLKLSPAGIALIKQFEGCSLTPYQDTAGWWTIGYGNRYVNGIAVTGSTSPLTQTQADALLLASLPTYENAVRSCATRPLSQNEFDAITSLTYNIGANALATSELMRKVNARTVAREDFLSWVYAKGVKLPGLVNRRNQEATLYGCA